MNMKIDYRRQEINYILAQINDLLKRLKEVNEKPYKLIEKEVMRERRRWAEIEGLNK